VAETLADFGTHWFSGAEFDCGDMFLSDLVKVSLRQVYRNKRRYKSVFIGISLGIAGLMTVLTMGDSVEKDLGRNLELLGSATVVSATWDFDRSKRWHHGQYSLKDAEAIRKLPDVTYVSPAVMAFHVPFNVNNKKFSGRLMGVEEEFFDTIHIPTSIGRRISKQDVSERINVCVIGSKVIEALFKDASNPLGMTIGIHGTPFTVVGVIGGVEDPDFMESVLIPISVARSRFLNMHEIRNIYIRVRDWNKVAGLQRRVSHMLKAAKPGYSDAIIVKYYPERIKTVQNAVLLVKLFLYAALGVTLLLGGLGITNVMLAAVRERTTEIGLRKAVGATESMIMTQFLVEAVSISLVGAIFGIAFGSVSVEVLRKVFGTVPNYAVFILSLVCGVGFAGLLGVASGYVPAKKASNLDPADAMRFE
jgi:putative ABC transport system permease protein